MPITDEQANQVKEQLLKQLDNFPEDKREQIKTQINSMTAQQIEEFVKQNQLSHLGGQCIFCSIIANKTPSYKIAESQDGIAILEINPLTEGHTLIVPKEHTKEISESIRSLAQQVAQKLKDKFEVNEIKMNEIKIMDHPIIELIPIYEDEEPTERKQATEEELKSLQEKITGKNDEYEATEEVEEDKKGDEEIPIIPPRIP